MKRCRPIPVSPESFRWRLESSGWQPADSLKPVPWGPAASGHTGSTLDPLLRFGAMRLFGSEGGRHQFRRCYGIMS